MASSTAHPKKFGRYEIEAEIGSGAMGRVYRANDPAVGRKVALKTIRREQLGEGIDSEYLQRFQREARAAGTLSHPNIVSVFDVGEDFIVMELLDGNTLARHLENGPLEVSQALDVFSWVADAIDSAHASGVVHRDIKPSNIMILADGRPKLMDFGVARLESSVMTRTGQVLGSPSYMAPEQIAGRETNPRSDLFSFAVVVYEGLTGQRPFQGDTITTVIYRVVNEPAPPPSRWRSDLPRAYDGFFEKALAKKPEERFGSAHEFIAALRRELGLEDAVATRPPGAGLTRRPPLSATRLALSDPDSEETAILLEPGELPREAPAAAAPAPEARGRGAVPRWAFPVAAGLVLAAAAALVLPRLGPVAPSQLSVETVPEGASVGIDGGAVGTTPLSVEVEPGGHTLRVSLEGYAPAVMRFDIQAGEQPAPLRFDLAPVVAHLRIDSRPSGADVFIEGEKVGKTPLVDLSVDPGRVDVLVTLVGVGTWRRTIEVSAGEALDIDAVLQSAQAAAGGGGRAIEVGPGVTPPRRIKGKAVRLPKAARSAGESGTVTIAMIVTEEGVPVELEVVESAGEILDAAVLEAVRSWRYEPAVRGGQKVRVRWRVRQQFQSAR